MITQALHRSKDFPLLLFSPLCRRNSLYNVFYGEVVVFGVETGKTATDTENINTYSHVFNTGHPGEILLSSKWSLFSLFFCCCIFWCFFFFLPIRPVVKVNSCNLHATCSSPGQMHLHPLIIDYSTYFHCVEAERIRRSMTRCLMRDLRLCCVEKEEPCDFLAAVRITTFSLLLLKPIEEQFKFLTLCR